MGENNFRVCEEVQHNGVFVAEGRRGGKKRKYICPLGAWTHRKAIWSVILMLTIYVAQYPGVMQGSQEGKRAKLWGPRAHFGANISMKIVSCIFSLLYYICHLVLAPARNTKKQENNETACRENRQVCSFHFIYVWFRMKQSFECEDCHWLKCHPRDRAVGN